MLGEAEGDAIGPADEGAVLVLVSEALRETVSDCCDSHDVRA